MTRACRPALALAAAAILTWAAPAPGQVRTWPSEPMPKPLAPRAATFPP